MQQITIDLTTIFTSAGTYSVTSRAHDSTGAFRDSDNSTAVSFKVAAAPSISVHPQNASYSAGGTATALSVTASVGDGGTLSYKWQKSTDSGTSYSDISGATSSTYTPDVSTASTYMYRCVVTNTLGATTASTTSNAATITVTAASNLTLTIVAGESAWGNYIEYNGTQYRTSGTVQVPAGASVYCLADPSSSVYYAKVFKNDVDVGTDIESPTYGENAAEYYWTVAAGDVIKLNHYTSVGSLITSQSTTITASS